jgi:hypothetical protein
MKTAVFYSRKSSTGLRISLLLLDTHWHRGYISLHECHFRFRSLLRYRNRIWDARFDCACGHGLGSAPRLAQPCRDPACVHGLNRRCCHLHSARDCRAHHRQAALNAQPHRAPGTYRPFYLRSSFRCLRWRICWTDSSVRRRSRRGRGIAGAFAGYQWRTGLVKALKVPDFVIALLEDAIAIGAGLFIVSRY